LLKRHTPWLLHVPALGGLVHTVAAFCGVHARVQRLTVPCAKEPHTFSAQSWLPVQSSPNAAPAAALLAVPALEDTTAPVLLAAAMPEDATAALLAAPITEEATVAALLAVATLDAAAADDPPPAAEEDPPDEDEDDVDPPPEEPMPPEPMPPPDEPNRQYPLLLQVPLDGGAGHCVAAFSSVHVRVHSRRVPCM
jgi:hypothetical protein